MKTSKELLDDSVELVSVPELYFQVDEMLSDPRYIAEDIGGVLSSDPAMSATLLKIVNSAYYGFPSRIDTLSRAITIIGFDELRSLVLATSAVGQFSKIPSDLVDMGDFWLHSMQCGVFAKLLAKKCAYAHPERLFVAGLLHEIGSLVIYGKLPDKAREILAAASTKRELVPALEQELLGFTHAQLSADILHNWNLPEVLVESIREHVSFNETAHYALESGLVFLANRLASVQEEGASIDDLFAEIPEEFWKITQLTEEDVLNVMDEAPAILSELLGLLIPALIDSI